MSLEKFFRPLKNPKIIWSILPGSLGLSALLTYADIKLDDRYVQAVGSTNAPVSNYDKIKYIKTHQNYLDTNKFIVSPDNKK